MKDITAFRIAGPYREMPDGGIYRFNEDGRSEELANFIAHIEKDIIVKDGEEIEARIYLVKVSFPDGKQVTFEVSATEFRSLGWVDKELGARAMIPASTHKKQELVRAIQKLSSPVQETRYRHLGWVVGHFLMAGDAVSDLPTELKGYDLMAVQAGGKDAIRKSLDLLRIAPRRQTVPLFAAMVTAPLAIPLDFVLWVYGPTGQRKSSSVALFLSHFGDFTKDTLPLNWTGTANGMEEVLYLAKDLPVVIDDYCPPLDPSSRHEMESKAHRLLRAVGDHHARHRMTGSCSLRVTHPPRCLPIVTAEMKPPGGESNQARALLVQWSKDSVNLDLLTESQKDTAALRASMKGYLQWLMARRGQIAQEWREQAHVSPPTLGAQEIHPRIIETVGKLLFGLQQYLTYAVEMDAISPKEKEQIWKDALQALTECARDTAHATSERNPANIIQEMLQSLISNGDVYLENVEGREPQRPELLGWHKPEGSSYYVANGRHIGWIALDRNEAYLHPNWTFAALAEYCRKTASPCPIEDSRELGEVLDNADVLLRKDPGRHTCKLRTKEERPRVFVVLPAYLRPELDPFEEE